jgi:hypothetical protein
MREHTITIPKYSNGPLYTLLLLEALIREGPSRFKNLGEHHRQLFLEYSRELDCLHEDFDFILFELQRAIEDLYVEPEDFDLKRLALTYHEDNFYVRVHAYREKVFILIASAFGLDLDIESRNLEFNKKVLQKLQELKLGRIEALISDFIDDQVIRDALKRRRLFVHKLSTRDWAMLEAASRIRDQLVQILELETDESIKAIEELDKSTDLDRLYSKKQEELGRICGRLTAFRDGIISALHAEGF